MSNEDIYAGLGRYAFTYEEANEKRLCDLSGGELMRIEILHLSLEDYDLLLLDEPTNHLDMMSISELVDALNLYTGTLVIISHDRDFVDKTCDKLLYLYNGCGYYYPGPYSEFRDKELVRIMNEEKERLQEENRQKREDKKKEQDAIHQDYQANKKKTRSTRDAPEKIMEKIDKLEKKKQELSNLCSLPEYYGSPDKLKEIDNKMNSIDADLQKLYEQLEQAM